MDNNIDVLLIYPQLGSYDNLVRDIPISLIYAATDSVKNDYNVKILDCRLYPDNWKQKIDEHLKNGCLLVGLSVMTGNPITSSLAISKYVKENYSIPIVWGGPHTTILPEITLENKYVDYVIRDWGSKPLYQLMSHLKDNSVKIDNIIGLGYKSDGSVLLNQTTCQFEILDFHDIPYDLVDIDSNKYNRFGDQLFFPIFTSFGCVYKCSFCSSPSIYKKIKGKKWLPLSVDSVVNHIEYLLNRYDFQRLQIYDDDSFVDLERMKKFFETYIKRGLHKHLTIDFRGVRINELDKMDNEFIKQMVKAKVEFMFIGAESGSDKSLKQMRKGITVAQTLRVNKKLNEYPSLRPHYNIMCGIPGETLEDLIQTKILMEILSKDNPQCLIGRAADWKPLPGTRLAEIAVQEYSLKLPQTLKEWAKIDALDAEKLRHPWYTRKMNNYIKLLQISGLLMDNKVEILEKDLGTDKSKILNILFLLAKLYRPILRFRLKYDLAGFLIEYKIKNFPLKIINMLKSNKVPPNKLS